MGKTQTINEIRSEVEARPNGVIVRRAVIEYVLGETFADDDAFETAVNDYVAQISWVNRAEFDWVNQTVVFHGYIVQP